MNTASTLATLWKQMQQAITDARRLGHDPEDIDVVGLCMWKSKLNDE